MAEGIGDLREIALGAAGLIRIAGLAAEGVRDAQKIPHRVIAETRFVALRVGEMGTVPISRVIPSVMIPSAF